GTAAHVKSWPAQTRAHIPINAATAPAVPPIWSYIEAVKWRTIMNQPTSQTPASTVWLRRAADANANVSKATAPTSGNRLQSTWAPENCLILLLSYIDWVTFGIFPMALLY